MAHCTQIADLVNCYLSSVIETGDPVMLKVPRLSPIGQVLLACLLFWSAVIAYLAGYLRF